MRKSLALSIVLIFLISFTTSVAFAKTKIAPTEAQAGKPFTIIDTPEGRLVDGLMAVFSIDGTETVIPLRTRKPYKTAQGRLPADMYSGDYSVSARLPDGTNITIGMFTVWDLLQPADPAIDPILGAPGTSFTITDPMGRMEADDVVFFYPEGTVFSYGSSLRPLTVSPDGTILTGTVPFGLVRGIQNFVSVGPGGLDHASRFGDLAFFGVALPDPPQQPYVEPTGGYAGSLFVLYDPQGRIAPGSVVLFYTPGTDPATGNPSEKVFISADGVFLLAVVPGALTAGSYGMSVRGSLAGLPFFGDIMFEVR